MAGTGVLYKSIIYIGLYTYKYIAQCKGCMHTGKVLTRACFHVYIHDFKMITDTAEFLSSQTQWLFASQMQSEVVYDRELW